MTACGLNCCAARIPSQLGLRRIEPDPLEIASELLDGVDRPEALDLDRDPAVALVPAHQVDGADVGRPLAANEPQALGDVLGGGGERFLEIALDAVLLERGGLAHLVLDVGEHLEQPDLEPVLAPTGALAHDDHVARVLDDGRRCHPVQRLVAAGVGVDQHRSVRLDHQQARGGRQERR